MSSLVDHARRELEAIHEDPETIEGYLKVVRAYADMNHSGGSHSIAVHVVHELLQQNNLSPLTNSPEEWQFHTAEVWGAEGGIWQNTRNSAAFSQDGGKSYWLLEDKLSGQHKPQPRYISRRVVDVG